MPGRGGLDLPEEWGIPFSYKTGERFTVLSVMAEGALGLRQFKDITMVWKELGHWPITHLVINPCTAGCLENSETLKQQADGARVEVIEDYAQREKSILNKLFAAPEDILFYDSQRKFRARAVYKDKYDLKRHVRQQFMAAEEPCK